MRRIRERHASRPAAHLRCTRNRSASDLDVSLDKLHPVGTLEGIAPAVDLLLEHRVTGKVLVVGDFDADGATSTALMIRALSAWGFASVDFLVPNRFEFGYGLTPEIVALAATRSPTLIVTVDNGISSIAGVAEARSRGMAVLITDHHLPGAVTPAANVIVNPNLPGSQFASRALAALALRSTSWLRSSVGSMSSNSLLQACRCFPVSRPGRAGTVADLVPLDANNRVLVSQGCVGFEQVGAYPEFRLCWPSRRGTALI